MPPAKHSCPNCGNPVTVVRWDAGYQYCKERTCFIALGEKEHVPVFETIPAADEIDLDVYDLDDIQSMYNDD